MQSEMGNNDDWDTSLLTKEEVEARMQKKVEAVIKRERAMAYAYSHQVFLLHPPNQTSLALWEIHLLPYWPLRLMPLNL